MQILANWRAVLTKAWSVRLIIIAAILSGAEFALGQLDATILGMPDGTFAAASGFVSAAALLARIMAQSDLEDDDDVPQE